MIKIKNNSTQLTYRPDIDGLRAIAVTAVVAFHIMPNRFGNGFVGVDVFFVISGFLISKIIQDQLQNKSFSFTEFYLNRIRRIFPSLILVLASCFIFGWITLFDNEYKQLGKHITASAIFSSNIALWQESGYFDSASDVKPLLHLWSLGVEEQIYIFLPLAIWLTCRLKINPFITKSVLVATSLYCSIALTSTDPIAAFFSPHTRAWEFLLGSAIAFSKSNSVNAPSSGPRNKPFHPSPPSLWQFPHLRQIKRVDILSVTGMLLLVLGFSITQKDADFPGVQPITPASGVALLILAGPNARFNRYVLSNKVMVLIGLISYPLYLWHWPILAFTRIIKGGAPTPITASAIAISSAVLAWYTYKYIETPIKKCPQKKLTSLALMASMAFLGGLGMTTKITHSQTSRQQLTSNQVSQLGWREDAKDKICEKKFLHDQKAEFCRISRSEDPTVMLIGDSMAWQLYFGLAKETAGTIETILSLNQGRCPGIFGLSDQADLEMCGKVTTRALKMAKDLPSVKTVILATAPIQSFDTNILKIIDSMPSDLTHASISEIKEIAQKSLSNNIMELIEHGKRVIFVKSNPSTNFPPASCIGRPPFEPAITTCATPRVNHTNANRTYNDIVSHVLEKFPQVQVMDLSELLCDGDLCWVIRNELMLYRDQHHLSEDGSLFVGKHLYALIKN